MKTDFGYFIVTALSVFGTLVTRIVKFIFVEALGFVVPLLMLLGIVFFFSECLG